MAYKSPLSYKGVAAPTPPNQVIMERSPTAKDFNFNIGDRWIVPTSATTPSNEEWILMSKEQNVAVWIQSNASGGTTHNNHELLVGTGTTTINSINNSTAGLPLLTQGASADPTWGVLAVPAGGTAKTSFVEYTPICGGTTTTGALQSVASIGSAGDVLTSNGAGLLPTFQAPGGGTLTVPSGGTGDTSFTAYAVVTGGITSVDPLQTVASLGTTGQVLTSQGAGALPIWTTNASSPGFTSIVVQTFTSNGTYTPTAGMEYCIVEALGGGGGGAGSTIESNPSDGGGAGGFCKGVFDAATIGASKAVTIGAGGAGSSTTNGATGGTTTFGVLLTANGGTGSKFNSSSMATGGTASGGYINVTGQTGTQSLFYKPAGVLTSFRQAGNGANTIYGAGGLGCYIAFGPGNDATGYGAGGGGAKNTSPTVGNLAGGNGASGLVIVTEFIGA